MDDWQRNDLYGGNITDNGRIYMDSKPAQKLAGSVNRFMRGTGIACPVCMNDHSPPATDLTI